MKILIADDHENVREGLTRLLDRQEDMSVVGYAENGLEALYKIKLHDPDIVIMDTGMPVLSGLDAVPLIHQADPDIRIILFSIIISGEYVYQSFHSGAMGYVHKLSPCKDIIDSIRAVVRGERFVSPTLKKRILQKYGEALFAFRNECRYDLLTNLEQVVFRLVVEGYDPSQIAELMDVSMQHILSIRKSISDKIQLHDIADMINYAESIGVLTPRNWDNFAGFPIQIQNSFL